MRDDLRKAIKSDAREVLSLLADLSEKQRRNLAPEVLEIYKNWSNNIGQPIDGVPSSLLAVTANLAMLGTASLTELKKCRVFGGFDSELGVEVLRSRHPSWLQDWCEWVLATVPMRWPFVRGLERAGLIEPPPTDLYILGMIVGATRNGAYHLLTHDQELLMQVPNLFQIEGGGENSLAAFDKYTKEDCTWAWALRTLAEEKVLKRSDLLRWSLEALQRDFANFRSGWFSRFHESLKPNSPERKELKSFYLSLLHSQIPPTVSFALKALNKMPKGSSLTPQELSDGLRAVWMSSQKGTVKSGLKLLKYLTAEEKTEHLTEVLMHPEPSLAALALSELRKLHPEPQGTWRARWAELTESLPATLKLEWQAWMGLDVPVEQASNAQQFEHPSGPSLIEPCSSQEEVIQLAAQLLEKMEPAWQIERALDGVLRFPRPSSPLLPALKKRVEQRLKSGHLTASLAAVFAVWMDENSSLPNTKSSQKDGETDLRDFLERRLIEVKEALMQRTELGLLSLPEKTNGELSAQTLVRRLKRAKPRPLDLAQAILRVTSVQEFTSTDDEEVDRLLAFALGLSDKGAKRSFWPFGKKKDLADTWKIAQVRRYFQGDWNWSWTVTRRDSKIDGKTYTHRFLKLSFDPTPPRYLSWAAQNRWEDDRAWRGWKSILFPAARDRWLLHGIEALSNNIDWWEARWADIVHLEQLEDFAESWGKLEAILLGFGLGCKEKGQAGLARELVARALATGQLSAQTLGDALLTCSHTEMIKMNRWAKALQEMKQFAPGAELARAFEILLAQATISVDRLLPSFLELVAHCGFQLSESVLRERLEAYQGKGVAAKAAKGLLTHF